MNFLTITDQMDNPNEGTWTNLSYMPIPNSVRTIISADYPTTDLGLIAGAWVFCFDEHNQLLFTKLRIRGIDIPGGKVEPEERIQFSDVHKLGTETALRETFEETKVNAKDLQLIGWRHFHSDGEPPTVSKFPFPDCYFLYYYGTVGSLAEFVEEPQPNGSIARLFLNEEDSVKEPKIQDHLNLYKRALQLSKESHL